MAVSRQTHECAEVLADDGAALGHRLADFKVTSEVHAMPEGQHSFIPGRGASVRRGPSPKKIT
ncbi:hypothetical protein [Streptomyces sp. LUP30]|uniref:hypothetical protein n=1 Tax=Streptomyces sp. LUP30 TaxID=1890285 RepID=UPI000851933F|nr:hypothetical protein [Streptomyces sp. LUP30]